MKFIHETKKEKSNNMGIKNTKISLKMKNKGRLSIEKNTAKKMPHYNQCCI